MAESPDAPVSPALDVPVPPVPVTVTVRFFGAARAAAGTAQEQVILAGQATVGAALRTSIDRHGPTLAAVLGRCSYLLAQTAVHGDETPVTHGDVIDVLPPFAGG